MLYVLIKSFKFLPVACVFNYILLSNLVCVFISTVCSGGVTMKVAPKVEVLKDETAKLPCSYTVSPSSSNTIVEWYIVSTIQILIIFQIQIPQLFLD